jgi:hypothetical protein
VVNKFWNDTNLILIESSKIGILGAGEGDMPHAPNNAPKATIDRIVVAGNVGFDFIKKEKSLI